MARDSTIGPSRSHLLAARRHAQRPELQPGDGAPPRPADANLDVSAVHRDDDAHAKAEAVATEEADEGSGCHRVDGRPRRADQPPCVEAEDAGASEERPEAALPERAA